MLEIETEEFSLLTRDKLRLVKNNSSYFHTYRTSDDSLYYKDCVSDRYREEFGVRVKEVGKKIDEKNHRGVCPILHFVSENGKFIGYIVPKVSGIDYSGLFSRNMSLKKANKIYLDLYFNVKYYEKNCNFVFPDLATNGNILYHPLEEKSTIIDVDSIATPELSAFVASTMIDNTYASISSDFRRLKLIQDKKGKVDRAILYTDKFYDKVNGSFTKKVNDLSLSVLYFSSITGFNFMTEELRDKENFLDHVAYTLIRTGLSEKDLFVENTLNLLDKNKDAEDKFLPSLLALEEKYELLELPSCRSGKKLRKFIERRG